MSPTSLGWVVEWPNASNFCKGTLDLIVLRALSTMGPQHAYGLASRLEQVAEHPLMLNQGTLYPGARASGAEGLDQRDVAADREQS